MAQTKTARKTKASAVESEALRRMSVKNKLDEGLLNYLLSDKKIYEPAVLAGSSNPRL